MRGYVIEPVVIFLTPDVDAIARKCDLRVEVFLPEKM